MELVFILSVTLIFYTYVGYPLGIWLLAQVRPAGRRTADTTPNISLIVVVRDGIQWLNAKLQSIEALDYPRDRMEVIVVSDGSSDATVTQAAEHLIPGMRVIICGVPQGKAACLNRAVSRAQGEILVFTDVRQRLDRRALRMLVRNFADPSVGAVSGELILDTDTASGFSGGIDLYWRYEKWIRVNEATLSSSAGVTGAIYAMRRDLYRPIPDQTLLDDVLIPCNVVAAGRRVVFERDALAFDAPSRSVELERRRKIRTLAGNYQLLQLMPELLNPFRNPIFLQFVSHKVLRLAVPLLLCITFLSNLWLALNGTPIYAVLFAGQLALYLVAIIGLTIPAAQQSAIIRLPTVFVLLNWFAVLGFIRFARNRNGVLQW
ncbi:MAG: glycosyltransferase family 2 protein [Gammaproteobacteria bacterium]|jgi:cellulose synthase/poly-beta-1,6-N-acetylglucosamine synthase-like glycosyltransferase